MQEDNRKSFKVTGRWYPEYVKLINSTEQTNYDLAPTAARVNLNPTKASVPYFSSNLVCKIKTCKCKYQMILPQKTDEPFLTFKVTKNGDHEHSTEKKQVRGIERKIIAEKVRSEFNGTY